MSEQDDDIMPIEVPTDEELFKGEPDPEVKAEEAEAEKPEAEAEPKEEVKEQTENEERGDHRVPLTELLNEREKRQQVQAQFEQMQAYLQQQEAQKQQQEQAGEQQWPDMFENPEHYQQWMQYLATQMPNQIQQQVQQQVNQQLAMQRAEFFGEMSLRQARNSDPETYDKAWEELSNRMANGDHTWRQAVLTASDPGQTLLEIYKKENVVGQVGTDPEAYFNKRIEELKQDPAALAALLGGDASSQSPRVDLPPSINKAGGGGTNAPIGISNADLWRSIND